MLARFRKGTTENTRVKLVAVAKDEAAYFPEWVHHHLFFGFDAIEIHINRTSDNSSAILDAICEKYPQVSYCYADWVDMCPPTAKQFIQYIIYSEAVAREKARSEFTHLLFIDIDEFWCSQTWSTSIQACIQQLSSDRPLCFEWLNDTAGDAFSPLSQTLTGKLSPLVKTLVPLSSDISAMQLHLPEFNEATPLLANGKTFKPKSNLPQAVHESLAGLKEFFVYHRSSRSMIEYVSLVGRGRPSDDFPFKRNRAGALIQERAPETIELPSDTFATYQESYQDFIQELAIDAEIAEAQAFVENRAEVSISCLERVLPSHYQDLVKIFSYVDLPEVKEAFTRFRKSMIERFPNRFGMIKQFVMDAELVNRQEALEYCRKLAVLRPNGPWVKAKLSELEESSD